MLFLLFYLTSALAWWHERVALSPSARDRATDIPLIADNPDHAFNNSVMFVNAVSSAQPGDVLIVANGTYWLNGGNVMSDVSDVTIIIDGKLRAPTNCYDGCWPTMKAAPMEFEHFFHFVSAKRVVLASNGPGAAVLSTSRGVIDGNGVGWWNKYVFGNHSHRFVPKDLLS